MSWLASLYDEHSVICEFRIFKQYRQFLAILPLLPHSLLFSFSIVLSLKPLFLSIFLQVVVWCLTLGSDGTRWVHQTNKNCTGDNKMFNANETAKSDKNDDYKWWLRLSEPDVASAIHPIPTPAQERRAVMHWGAPPAIDCCVCTGCVNLCCVWLPKECSTCRASAWLHTDRDRSSSLLERLRNEETSLLFVDEESRLANRWIFNAYWHFSFSSRCNALPWSLRYSPLSLVEKRWQARKAGYMPHGSVSSTKKLLNLFRSFSSNDNIRQKHTTGCPGDKQLPIRLLA